MRKRDLLGLGGGRAFVGRGCGGSEGNLVLLFSVGRAVACAGVVWCLHFGMVSGPVGIYINYHG